MRSMFRSWLFLTLLVPAISASAADYYVNPAGGSDGVGSDDSTGTSMISAWATVSHAFSVMGALSQKDGHTLHIMVGTITTSSEGIDPNTLSEGQPYITIPSTLSDLTIEGVSPASTVFDPYTSVAPNFQDWMQFSIFTATGNSNLTVRNLGMINGRGFLKVVNTTGMLTVDNISIVSPLVGPYSNQPPIHVHGHNGDVSISNVTTSGTRSDGDGIDSYGGGSLLIHDITGTSGNVSISNVSANGCVAPWQNGGAFCIDKVSGDLEIDNVVATNNQSNGDGGAFYIGTVTGAVSISNVSFDTPYSQYGSGGAICINDARSTIDISSISISGGFAAQDGAGMSIKNIRGNVTLTGMNVSGNDITWGTGGAVSIKTLLASGLHITVSNATFSGNSTSSSSGGALAVDGNNAPSDTLTMDNLVIKDNVAGTWGDGGGFWVDEVSVVELKNSTISNNALSDANNGYSGGGGYIGNVENLVVDNVAFIGNVSNGNGGGLAIPNDNNVNESETFNQVAFIDNVADGNKWTGDGGGLHTTQAGIVNIDYALFAGNYASDDGGAMLFDRFNASSSLHISSITMAYNEAGDDGSAIYNTQSIASDSLTIDNSIIWANGDTSRTADPSTLSTQDAIDGNLNNLDVSYSNIQTDGNLPGVTNDPTNMNVDPFFSDPTTNDFSVLPGSPMLDQGDPNADPSMEPQPNNNIINIGYTPPFTTDPVTGETVAAPVGSSTEPVTVGTVTAASLASTRAFINKYMMIGSPVVPDPAKHATDPDSAWGDDLNHTAPGISSQTWRFSRWMNVPDSLFYGYVRYREPDNNSYPGGVSNLTDSLIVTPGYGYWFVYGDGAYTEALKAVRDTTILGISPSVIGGMVNSGTSPYVLPLDPKPADSTGVPFGYNMMANPWPFPISWQDVRFGKSASGPWLTPLVAADSGWVDAYAITWDNVNQGYVPKTGALAPWEGFWVIVRTQTPIWIQFNPDAVPATAPVMAPEFTHALNQSLSWSTLITIRSTQGHLGDLNTWIGLGPNLKDDYDTFDANDPQPIAWETLFNRTRLVDVVNDTEYVLTNTRLSRDYRKDDMRSSIYKKWLITPTYFLDADNPDGKTLQNVQIRLQFPTIGTLPDSIMLSLYAYAGPEFYPDSSEALIDDLSLTPDTLLTLSASSGGVYKYGYYWIVASLRPEYLAATRTADLPDANAGLPQRTELSTAYPNPFNSSIAVKFSLAHSSHAALRIYNALGQEVTTLVNDTRPVGHYQVIWNAEGQASGVYFIRFDVPGEKVHQVRKIVYQK